MKTPTHPLRRWLTHSGFFVGGLALGFVVWKSIAPSPDEKAASAAGNSSAGESRASDRSRERPEGFKNGTEILKFIAPHVFEENEQLKGRRSMTYAGYLQQRSKRLLEEADKLPVAEDVAAAAIAMFEKGNAIGRGRSGPVGAEEMKILGESELRLIHWLRADPAAALNHISVQGVYNDVTAPVFAVISEKGADAAIGWMKNADPPLGRGFNDALGMFVSASGDRQQLEKLKEMSTPVQWNQMMGQLPQSWPLEKGNDLFDFAFSGNSPTLPVRFAQSKGKEGADWLIAQLNSENVDPAFKESITKSREYQQLMRNNAHLPLDMRLEAIGPSEPTKDREMLALELGSRDVATALDDASRDWRFAFRSGKVSFEDVYNAVVADLPELASGSPDAIRLQVFKELAEENGPAAMEALNHTPEPDKWALALKPTQWMFYGVDPQKFYNYLQKIPHDDPALHQARFESWVTKSSSNLAAYSRDYVTWVKDMPAGVDREMAAIGILRTLGPSDPALIAEVDALVVDPAMRARIKAPPPVKR